MVDQERISKRIEIKDEGNSRRKWMYIYMAEKSKKQKWWKQEDGSNMENEEEISLKNKLKITRMVKSSENKNLLYGRQEKKKQKKLI